MYLPRPNEWSEGFKGGTLATQSSIAWLAGHLSHRLAPDTAGRYGYTARVVTGRGELSPPLELGL